MSAQGGASGGCCEEYQQYLEHNNITLPTTKQQQQGGVELGLTQGASAKFYKGPKTPHMPLYHNASTPKMNNLSTRPIQIASPPSFVSQTRQSQ